MLLGCGVKCPITTIYPQFNNLKYEFKRKMKTLNLHRLWEIVNFISQKEKELNEQNIYPYLLGINSGLFIQDYEYFLEEYSFKIDKDEVCVFNNDSIPYEEHTREDYSHIPIKLLKYNEQQLTEWVDKKVKEYLKESELQKEEEKRYLKQQIEILTKRLNNL